MINLFPAIIVSEFLIAAIICNVYGFPIKGLFYLFSALINVTVMFMRGA